MRIVLIGGSGFVGRALYQRLEDRHIITIMSRHKPHWLTASATNWTNLDIRDPASVKSALSRNFDMVVDLVATLNQKEQKHKDLNSLGTKNIVDALAEQQGVKLVYLSAINSEEGTTEYFRTKFEAESNIVKHGNYAIIRPSVFYGDNDYLVTQLMKTARRFTPFFPRSGPMCPVYIGDFAKVFESLLGQTGAFNVCSREMLTLGDMLNAIRARLGKGRVPESSLSMFKIAAPVLNAAGIISSEQLAMLEYSFYREDTVLYKYVDSPMTFESFIDSYVKNSALQVKP